MVLEQLFLMHKESTSLIKTPVRVERVKSLMAFALRHCVCTQ